MYKCTYVHTCVFQYININATFHSQACANVDVANAIVAMQEPQVAPPSTLFNGV